MGINHQHIANRNSFVTSLQGTALITFGIIVVGFLLQVVLGEPNVSALNWPVNVIVLLFVTLSIIFFGVYKRSNKLVKWLASGQVAICAIVSFVCITLLMGFISQAETANPIIRRLGLNAISSSWPYFLSLLFLLFSLGIVTIKRAIPFKRKNIGFLFNHLGLWITLAAASFGYPDQLNLRTQLSLNSPKAYAYTEDGRVATLPFDLSLLRFQLEEYKPKLTLVNTNHSSYAVKSGENTLRIKEAAQAQIGLYQIKVSEYLNLAISDSITYKPSDTIGAAPAAYIQVKSANASFKTEGWISCGSLVTKRNTLRLNDSLAVVMLYPEAKKLSSNILISNTDSRPIKMNIEINKPAQYKSWNIYQIGYDETLGKWSQKSTVALVRDPWLPVVKTGLFMLIIGAVFIFWQGKSKQIA